MSCRIGITTDPERRKSEHQRDYPSLRNWMILSTHTTKSAAQTAEDRAKLTFPNCSAHRGGAGPEFATWCLYKFDH